MSIRITSGSGFARDLDAEGAVHGAEQAQVGTAGDELLHQPQVGRVVLHVEQGAQRRVLPGLASWPRSLGADLVRGPAGCRGRGQLEPEHAALPDDALHPDHAAHHLHQQLAHHQADAGALLAAALLSEPVEGLEELRQLLGRQPEAGVPDADADASRRGRGALDHDRSRRPVVLDGIREEVDEDLLQPDPIGEDEAGGSSAGKVERECRASAPAARSWPGTRAGPRPATPAPPTSTAFRTRSPRGRGSR